MDAVVQWASASGLQCWQAFYHTVYIIDSSDVIIQRFLNDENKDVIYGLVEWGNQNDTRRSASTNNLVPLEVLQRHPPWERHISNPPIMTFSLYWCLLKRLAPMVKSDPSKSSSPLYRPTMCMLRSIQTRFLPDHVPSSVPSTTSLWQQLLHVVATAYKHHAD